MPAFTDFAENKLIDWLWRGQAMPVLPASWFFGLLAEVPGDSVGSLVEIVGGSYARVPVVRSLGNWAGTQGVGTTAVSAGTSASTSNNGLISFPAPTADWGLVRGIAIFDAAAAGNCWFADRLAEARTIRAGDAPPTFLPGAFGFTLDAN